MTETAGGWHAFHVFLGTKVTVTIDDLGRWKRRGEPFPMLTAYDYTMARLLTAAAIPVLLVGDSLGMVALGHATTLPVTMAEMLSHCRAVARGATASVGPPYVAPAPTAEAAGPLLVGDLPFNSYQASDEEAIRNAASLLQAGMHAVKLEGGVHIAGLVSKLVERGIPVMAHIGMTPQSVHRFGGFRVQGRDQASAGAITASATALAQAGAFAVVLECIPRELAAQITRGSSIPTIGIGAGPDCDGQVLVSHDLLGLTAEPPRFAVQFAALGDATIDAAERYAAAVREKSFPNDTQSYHSTVGSAAHDPNADRTTGAAKSSSLLE